MSRLDLDGQARISAVFGIRHSGFAFSVDDLIEHNVCGISINWRLIGVGALTEGITTSCTLTYAEELHICRMPGSERSDTTIAS